MSECAQYQSPVDRERDEILHGACQTDGADVYILPDVLPHQSLNIHGQFKNATVIEYDAAWIAVAKPAWNCQVTWKDGKSIFEEKVGGKRT